MADIINIFNYLDNESDRFGFDSHECEDVGSGSHVYESGSSDPYINKKEGSVISNTGNEKTINVTALAYNTASSLDRRLGDGLIQPAAEDVQTVLAEEHAAEPIKSIEDINRISEYLICNYRYRDNMLFIVGINFGLRVSDLRNLRFSDIINENNVFKDRFPVFEKKTRNTRKVRRNRYITINRAVIEAVTLYLQNTDNVKLSDYMFRSESNNSKNLNKPISKQAIDNMLKNIAIELGLSNRMATHSLRKTFAYHQMLMSGNDPRKLLLLQKMFGHATAAQTLDYIGITSEEIDEAYLKLNLGSLNYNYLVDSSIGENDIISA